MARIFMVIAVLCTLCAEAKAAHTKGSAHEFESSYKRTEISRRRVEEIRIRIEAAGNLLESSRRLLVERMDRLKESRSTRDRILHDIALVQYLKAVKIIEDIAVEVSFLSMRFPELARDAEYWRSLAEDLKQWVQSNGYENFAIGR